MERESGLNVIQHQTYDKKLALWFKSNEDKILTGSIEPTLNGRWRCIVDARTVGYSTIDHYGDSLEAVLVWADIKVVRFKEASLGTYQLKKKNEERIQTAFNDLFNNGRRTE